MGLKENFWNWIKPDGWKAGSSDSAVPFATNTSPQWLPANYRNFAQNAYGCNATVYRCMNAIFMAFAEATLRVYSDKDGTEIPDHPLRKLIERPSPFTNEYELWEESLLYYLLSGNWFWEKIRSRSGQVVELRPLRPDRIEIVPSKTDYIDAFIYTIGDSKTILMPDDILHIKAAHPLDDYWGQSPIIAQLRDIQTDNEETDFTMVTLQNKGIAPGLVITTESKLTPDQVKMLKSDWKEKYGKLKKGEPLFLKSGMDVKVISLNMNDLGMPALRDVSQSSICNAFNVPAMIAGVVIGLNRSTFTNYKEARVSFREDTIFPMHDRTVKAINADEDLMPAKDKASARFDSSAVPAFAEQRAKKWDQATAAVAGGWMTINQALTHIGLPEVQNGDVFLRGAMVQEIDPDSTQKSIKPDEVHCN